MSDLEAQIERIVRQVLAEMHPVSSLAPPAGLRGGDGGHRAGARPQGPEASQQNQAPLPRETGDWVVDQRVVTLAQLPERWDGVRRVVVPVAAVVTPAVYDELRRRGVALDFRPQPSKRSLGRRVGLVTVSRSYDSGPLERAIAELGFDAQTQRRDCLIAATDGLARDLAAGLDAAILVSRHTAAALCLANRCPGVRAILAVAPGRVAGDADAVGANVLVLDPRQHSPFATRHMLRLFLEGIPRACPDVFRTRLG